MRAVQLDAAGDIAPPKIEATNNAVAWCQPRRGNYLATPIAIGDLLWGDLDGIVTESIGIRWATAGPFESFHLGGGPGGAGRRGAAPTQGDMIHRRARSPRP